MITMLNSSNATQGIKESLVEPAFTVNASTSSPDIQLDGSRAGGNGLVRVLVSATSSGAGTLTVVAYPSLSDGTKFDGGSAGSVVLTAAGPTTVRKAFDLPVGHFALVASAVTANFTNITITSQEYR